MSWPCGIPAGYVAMGDGQAVRALPRISAAPTHAALAALVQTADTLSREVSGGPGPGPLAANVRLLAACMAGLPDMLAGADQAACPQGMSAYCLSNCCKKCSHHAHAC